jgi:hypothetical protein
MAYTTINKGSSYFNTVLYTGDGTTNQTKAITFGFQPDWAWFKARDAGQSHVLVDSVRGGTKALFSEAAVAENTLAVAQLFTSTGMIVSNDASANSLNSNGSSKVSWGWLGSNTTASNTSGTITSTVSVNTTAGFSVGTYTGNGTGGATIGHGLGSVPKWIIVKERSGTNQWLVYHVSNGATKYMILETTGAVGTASTLWNDTTPTTNLFTVGSSTSVNGSGLTYVFYAFSDVKGYSKFGSYTGNGSADGTFVYTGFKPAFVMVKVTDITNSWFILDNKRLGYNPTELFLNPNSSSAESGSTGAYVDFTSNGFKWRTTSNAFNGSSNNYIYAAFAENPFVSSTQIPTTAR